MDRRSALRMLAASGAAVTASTVVSRPAFADSASGCGAANVPDLNVPLRSYSISGEPGIAGQIRLQYGKDGDFACSDDGNPAGVQQPQQWRVSQAFLGSESALGFFEVPSGQWFTEAANALDFVVQGPPNSGPYKVRTEFRAVCCYGGCASWACLQIETTFEIGVEQIDRLGYTDGILVDEVVSPIGASSDNCENPPPTCP